jgi:hypothetical protein
MAAFNRLMVATLSDVEGRYPSLSAVLVNSLEHQNMTAHASDKALSNPTFCPVHLLGLHLSRRYVLVCRRVGSFLESLLCQMRS